MRENTSLKMCQWDFLIGFFADTHEKKNGALTLHKKKISSSDKKSSYPEN